MECFQSVCSIFVSVFQKFFHRVACSMGFACADLCFSLTEEFLPLSSPNAELLWIHSCSNHCQHCCCHCHCCHFHQTCFMSWNGKTCSHLLFLACCQSAIEHGTGEVALFPLEICTGCSTDSSKFQNEHFTAHKIQITMTQCFVTNPTTSNHLVHFLALCTLSIFIPQNDGWHMWSTFFVVGQRIATS